MLIRYLHKAAGIPAGEPAGGAARILRSFLKERHSQFTGSRGSIIIHSDRYEKYIYYIREI